MNSKLKLIDANRSAVARIQNLANTAMAALEKQHGANFELAGIKNPLCVQTMSRADDGASNALARLAAGLKDFKLIGERDLVRNTLESPTATKL